MKKIARSLVAHLSELTLLTGAALAAVGAGMYSLPVGVIVGGALLAGGAVLSMWGDGDTK